MHDACILVLECMMHTPAAAPPIENRIKNVTCLYDAFINVPRSLTLMHVCMMHISLILDLDSEACMYVWCMYL